MAAIARVSAALAAVGILGGAAAAEPDAAPVLQRVRTGVVTILTAQTGPVGAALLLPEESESGDRVLGSGTILTQDGLILTANHAVSSTKDVIVVFWDMAAVRGEVIAGEPFLDIALVQVRREGLDPLPWRTDEAPEIGETVYAVGTPSAFSGEITPSISRGIVSAVHRTVEGALNGYGEMLVGDLIETDAQVSPGQSGGALVDDQGRLLGMCLAVYRPLGTARGVSLAVPADAWLKSGLEEFARTGSMPLGSFGVQVLPVSFERAKSYGLQGLGGVEVSGLEKDGPFERAGIRVGDVVTAAAGERLYSTQRLRQIEARQQPGSRIAVEGVRPGDGRYSMEVEVASRPSVARREPDTVWRGMVLSPVNDDVRRQFGLHYRDGVCVKSVDSSTSAYRAGLRTGDVIVEVNNMSVKTLADFRQVVSAISENAVVRVRTTDGVGHIQGETVRQ